MLHHHDIIIKDHHHHYDPLPGGTYIARFKVPLQHLDWPLGYGGGLKLLADTKIGPALLQSGFSRSDKDGDKRIS